MFHPMYIVAGLVGLLAGIAPLPAMTSGLGSGSQSGVLSDGANPNVPDVQRLKPVTDPEILRQLNDGSAAKGEGPSGDNKSAQVEAAQRDLRELGYNPGAIDGILGPATREAIREFQADHELPVDGKFSGMLAFKLELEVSKARQRATPEGQALERERERLLAMDREELVAAFEKASNDRKKRILELLGERASELPARLASNLFGKPGVFRAATLSMLATMQYPRSDEGINQFQQDLGAEPTGDLTLGQFQELSRRQIRLFDTEVYVGGFGNALDIFTAGPSLQVEGTWVLEGESIADPVNKSQLKCRRDRGVCSVVHAAVVIPRIDSNDGTYMLEVSSEEFEIISWNTSQVIARTGRGCRSSILTININAKEVYEVTQNSSGEICDADPLSLPALGKPRIARLLPGWQNVYDWWRERKSIAAKYLNPRHVERLRSQFDNAVPANPAGARPD